MILGQVTADSEAVIPLRLQGFDGRTMDVTAVIDTGYDGRLSPPAELVDQMGFPWQRLGWGTLADDSETMFDVHKGGVVWDGELREIAVDCTGSAPMVGMGLLEGFRLTLEATVDGPVRIERLSGEEPLA